MATASNGKDPPVVGDSPESDNTQRYVDENDICLMCEKKTNDGPGPSADTVCCHFCDYKFHALCTDNESKVLSDNICTKSFFDAFVTRKSTTGVNSKRKGNFVFVCDPCMTKREDFVASDTKSHVKSLETKIESLESDISEIKSILLKGSHVQAPTSEHSNPHSPVPVTSTCIKNPWDNIEKVKNLRSNAKLIIGGDEPGKNISKSDLEAIAVDNKLPVENYQINSTGKTVLTFATQNDRDKASSKIKAAFPDSKIEQASELLPTISIANISKETSAEDLYDAVMRFNPEIESYVKNNGGQFKVLGRLRKQNKNDLLQANVRVSNNIRKLLENSGNRVCTGFGYSCKVYDHFHIKRCNTCQKYNHYSDNCPTKLAPVCSYCADHHKSEDCPRRTTTGFIPTCVNCKLSKDKCDTNHESSSSTCPTYKRAQDVLRNSILYYNSKNL